MPTTSEGVVRDLDRNHHKIGLVNLAVLTIFYTQGRPSLVAGSQGKLHNR